MTLLQAGAETRHADTGWQTETGSQILESFLTFLEVLCKPHQLQLQLNTKTKYRCEISKDLSSGPVHGV